MVTYYIRKEAKINMSPYYNELPIGTDDEFLMTFLVVYLSIMGVFLLFALACWIMRTVSLHKIAKRRGISNAWLAWIPIGNQWILGSIADQYQHLVKGKVTSRRKVLLALNVVCFVVGIAYFLMVIVLGVMAGIEGDMETLPLVLIIPYLLLIGTGITTMVFYHICNYDLYHSCNPNNAVAFLVLGIIFSVCEPFFYMSCRKKDLGMIVPEPTPAPVPTEPVELPEINPEF